MWKCLYLLIGIALFSSVKADDQVRVPLRFEVIGEADSLKEYQIVIDDLPKPSNVMIYQVKLNGAIAEIPGYLREDGILAYQEQGYPTISWIFGNFGYGESVVFIVEPRDKKNKPLKKSNLSAIGALVPEPLEVKDSEGRKIEISGKDGTGNSFIVRITGFKPNERIKVRSCSCNECFTLNQKTDMKGTCKFFYNPGVKGFTQGPFELTLTDTDMNQLKIQHYWGRIAYTPKQDYDSLKERFGIPDASK